jgi:hypothetical protein
MHILVWLVGWVVILNIFSSTRHVIKDGVGVETSGKPSVTLHHIYSVSIRMRINLLFY